MLLNISAQCLILCHITHFFFLPPPAWELPVIWLQECFIGFWLLKASNSLCSACSLYFTCPTDLFYCCQTLLLHSFNTVLSLIFSAALDLWKLAGWIACFPVLNVYLPVDLAICCDLAAQVNEFFQLPSVVLCPTDITLPAFFLSPDSISLDLMAFIEADASN